MNDEAKSLIQYRLERAKGTLEDARLLFNNERLFSCVNRIYYAMFYAVNALLLSKGLSSSKHSGVLALFNKEFINSNIINRELGRFYTTMFEFRQKSDYKDMVKFEKVDVQNWLEKADGFISEIEGCLAKI